MKSSVFERLPPSVLRSLKKLGRDLGIARKKRRLTAEMMAERMGVSKPTYLRAERGDPTVGLGVYAMALFVLGLGAPLGDLVDASRDDQALVLDVERLPVRVRPKTRPTEL
jgi:transcriptional regulator with XRE-family HTH domain